MTAVANNNNKIQVEGLRFRGAASESTMQLIGGAINQLFDDRDAEQAARIAADNVLQGQITTNTNDISTLTSRVNNAKNVVWYNSFGYVGTGGGGLAAGAAAAVTLKQWVPDGGTWKLINWDSPTTTKSVVYDSGVSSTSNLFIPHSWVNFVTGSSNIFYNIEFWQISSV